MLIISRMMRDFDRAAVQQNPEPASLDSIVDLMADSILSPLASAVAFCSGAGLGILTLLNFPLAATLALPVVLAFPFVPAIASVVGVQWLIAKGQIQSKSCDRQFDGMRIVGSKKDIGMFVSSVRAVQDLTRNFNASAELPPRVRRKIAGFVDDMTPATSRIAVLSKNQSGSYTAEDKFIVNRQVLGPKGDYAFSELARLKTSKIS